MSAFRAFRVRKQLNSLHRSLIKKPYSTEPSKESPIASRSTTSNTSIFDSSGPDWTNIDLPSRDEQLNYLEEMDEFRLNLTLEAVDRLTKDLHAINATSSRSPDPQTLIPSIPKYHMAKPKLEPAVSDALGKIATLRQHLEDLKLEPYRSRTKNADAEWLEETRQLSRTERQDMYKSLFYEEQALAARLVKQSEEMLDIMNKIKGPAEEKKLPRSSFRSLEGPWNKDNEAEFRSQGGTFGPKSGVKDAWGIEAEVPKDPTRYTPFPVSGRETGKDNMSDKRQAAGPESGARNTRGVEGQEKKTYKMEAENDISRPAQSTDRKAWEVDVGPSIEAEREILEDEEELGDSVSLSMNSDRWTTGSGDTEDLSIMNQRGTTSRGWAEKVRKNKGAAKRSTRSADSTADDLMKLQASLDARLKQG